MAQQETSIFKRGLLALSSIGTVLFRNNVGTGYQGQPLRHPDGSVLLKFARVIKFGLFEGSCDGIGWTSVVVTPEMVGKKIAVFTALESKTDIGKPSKPQEHFISQVDRAGGISGIFRSDVEAVGIVQSWLKRVGAK